MKQKNNFEESFEKIISDEISKTYDGLVFDLTKQVFLIFDECTYTWKTHSESDLLIDIDKFIQNRPDLKNEKATTYSFYKYVAKHLELTVQLKEMDPPLGIMLKDKFFNFTRAISRSVNRKITL